MIGLPAEVSNQCAWNVAVPGAAAMRISLESGAAIALHSFSIRTHRYGPLTPRQRPNRQGRYHRAPGGLVNGTLSIPEVPQG